MSKRWRATQLVCRDPSIRLTPLPIVCGNTLQPLPQIRDFHRINVDANILGEETSESLQKFAFEIDVDVFKRSNHHGETSHEAYWLLGMAVYESCHLVELGFTKEQHVAASGEKRINATKQIGNFRGWFIRCERSDGDAEKTSGCRFGFPKVSLKLLNCRIQQLQMNVGVSGFGVAEVSRCKHNGFLVENLGGWNSGALGWEKYRLCESITNQLRQQSTVIPTLECRPAKIHVVDLDALPDDVFCQAFQK